MPAGELPTRHLTEGAVLEEVISPGREEALETVLVMRQLQLLDLPEPPTLELIGRIAKVKESDDAEAPISLTPTSIGAVDHEPPPPPPSF